MKKISIPDHLYSALEEMSELNCVPVEGIAAYFIVKGGQSLGYFEIVPDVEGGDQDVE